MNYPKILIFNRWLTALYLLIILLAAAFIYLSGVKKDGLKYFKGYFNPGEGKDGLYYVNYTPIYSESRSWKIGPKTGTESQPMIAAESGFLVDINSGNVLFEKNANQKMRIASLAKVMTAVVALEHADLDREFKVSENASGVGENSMGVSSGEKYTLEELLYGLILHSGNDAAYVISEGLAGNADTFVSWMNIKAKELNMSDTKFYDPSGLDDNSRSTGEDLVKLTRYAMRSADFRKIVKTMDIELESENHKYLYLENQTNLLQTYPGVEGVKTGYTEEAGLCLITYAQNGGCELIGVVLNSIDRKGDMILMLDHGFSTMGVKVEHNLL